MKFAQNSGTGTFLEAVDFRAPDEVLQTEKVASDVAPREVVASFVVEQPGKDSSRNS